MIDIQQLTSLISAFRVETEKESISPETVGSILQTIADLLADGRFFEVGLSQSFLEYGLWQDYGTGRETPRGNSGDLGRDKKRQCGRWFSSKYYASVMRLKEFYEENIGKEFLGIISDALNKSHHSMI